MRWLFFLIHVSAHKQLINMNIYKNFICDHHQHCDHHVFNYTFEMRVWCLLETIQLSFMYSSLASRILITCFFQFFFLFFLWSFSFSSFELNYLENSIFYKKWATTTITMKSIAEKELQQQYTQKYAVVKLNDKRSMLNWWNWRWYWSKCNEFPDNISFLKKSLLSPSYYLHLWFMPL